MRRGSSLRCASFSNCVGSSKAEVWVFECGVKMEEEFSGQSGQRDFGGFACGAQAEVKDFQFGMTAGGGEGAEVEDAADFGASAAHAASAREAAALAVARGQAGEAGD